MGASRTSFEKLQRDRAKKAKASAKRDKRLDKSPEDALTRDEDEETIELSSFAEGDEIPPDQLLKMVADLHKQFEDEEITFEDFEDRKTELFALLSVD
jgi:ATPase subunit of ABC transporter with duplicated ATPase domains